MGSRTAISGCCCADARPAPKKACRRRSAICCSACAFPGATPTLHTSGTIYGFTAKGGNGEDGAAGVLFSYTHGLKPFIALQLWAGAEGTQIGILGQGFSTATGVKFGSVAASFTVVNDTYLIATVPAGAQTANVTVSEPSGNLATLRKFKVLPAGLAAHMNAAR